MFVKGRVKYMQEQMPSLLGHLLLCVFDERSDPESPGTGLSGLCPSGVRALRALLVTGEGSQGSALLNRKYPPSPKRHIL